MKQPLQISFNIQQSTKKDKPVEVQPWVNTALAAKEDCSEETTNLSGNKLQLNMMFSKCILNRR